MSVTRRAARQPVPRRSGGLARRAGSLVASLILATGAVLGHQSVTAVAERPELELEVAAGLMQGALELEREELASLRPVSELAERGGRVVSQYTMLKRFSTGRIARDGPRLAAEIAGGDAIMLTALSGLPASFEASTDRLARFERASPFKDTVEDTMAIADAEASEKPLLREAKADTGTMELGYAPASGPAASSRFDTILSGEGPSFVPPIGEKDHAWAATPLPAEAFGTAEQTCLATGIYFEARGESERGQAAVAQVILNRVRNPAYPDTICGVVYQNRNWRNRCQFSFACDGRADRITNKRAYERAERIAMDVTTGREWLADVGSATHYHATYVRPRWARTMEKVDKIGLHVFYRTYNGGWN